MAYLPAAEWLPDMPDYQNPGATNIRNVIPRTPQSYGAVAGLQAFGGALPSACKGTATFSDPGGNVTVFAGTLTDLYSYSSSSLTAANISKSAGAYSVPPSDRWKFTQFGQRVIAANYNSPQQSFVLGSSTKFADLAAAAPQARYIAVMKGFLVAGNTYDGTGGDQPQRVWWSALNDPTNWPTPGTSTAAQYQSDYNDLWGDAGSIQGLVGNLGNADGAVFMERAIWRMVYAGPPSIFYFLPAQGVKGTNAPGSIVQLGSVVYYLGEDGFYAFDGLQSVPIGANKIDKTFFADLDQSHIGNISGTVDPINKVIFWIYPGQNNVNGRPNRLLCYNWQLQRWTVCDIECEAITRALTFGYTLDTLPGKLDDYSLPLDSRSFTGGNLILAGFDSAHTFGYFNGTTLAATVETSEVQLFPGRLSQINNARPIVDGGSPTVAIATRNRQEDAYAYNAGTTINALGTTPQRANGRYVRAKVTLPAGAGFTHIQGVEIEATATGIR